MENNIIDELIDTTKENKFTFSNETFCSLYSQLIKIAIYRNKGTDNENMLNSFIDLHNKISTIKFKYSAIHKKNIIGKQNRIKIKKTNSKKINKGEKELMYSIMKRFNLQFKTDHDGSDIVLSDVRFQHEMFNLPMRTLIFDDYEGFVNYVTNINFLNKELPWSFFLQFDDENKEYDNLIFDYVKLIFWMSEYLLLSINKGESQRLERIKTIVKRYYGLVVNNDIHNIIEEDYFIESKLIITNNFIDTIEVAGGIANNVMNKANIIDDDSDNKKMISDIVENLGNKDIIKFSGPNRGINNPKALIETITSVSKTVATKNKNSKSNNVVSNVNKVKKISALVNTVLNNKNVPDNIKTTITGFQNTIDENINKIDETNINNQEPDEKTKEGLDKIMKIIDTMGCSDIIKDVTKNDE